MFCRFCGAELPDDIAFCIKCGKRLSEQPQEEPNVVEAPNFMESVPDSDTDTVSDSKEEPEAGVRSGKDSPQECVERNAGFKPSVFVKQHPFLFKILRFVVLLVACWLLWSALGDQIIQKVPFLFMDTEVAEELAENQVLEQLASFPEVTVSLKGDFQDGLTDAKILDFSKDFGGGEGDFAAALLALSLSESGIDTEKECFFFRYDLTYDVYQHGEYAGEISAVAIVASQFKPLSDYPMAVLVVMEDTGEVTSTVYEEMFQIEEARTFYQDNGTLAVEVVYTFTNLMGETVTPSMTFTVHAYQDGVELERDFFGGNGSELREVLEGATVTLSDVYELKNTSSSVLVQIKPWLDFENTVYYEKSFEISPASTTEVSEPQSGNFLLPEGKWYASSLEENPAFLGEKYLSYGSESSVYGLELEILSIDGEYYAHLTANLHPFDYGFHEQRRQNDPLLKIVPVSEGTWIIEYDEIDESSEYRRVEGISTMTLTVNAVGELYAEIDSATGEFTSMEKTKLYPSSEWLNGKYMYYDQASSASYFGNEIMGYYSAFDCESILSYTLEGHWMSSESSTIYDTYMMDIYVVTVTDDQYRGSIYEVYYYEQNDLETLHHAVFYDIYADEIAQEMILDDEIYTRLY